MAACPTTYWVYVELEAKVVAGTAVDGDYDKLFCKGSVADAQTTITGTAGATVSFRPTISPDFSIDLRIFPV